MVNKKTKKNVKQETENNSFWIILGNLPISLGVSLAGFGVVAVVLLLLENFKTGLLLGIGFPVALFCFYGVNRFLVPESPASRRERRIFDVLAILFLLVWGVFNSYYTSQNVYLYRDPALYNSTARWLMDHDNIAIPAENPFGDNPNLYTTSNSGVDMIKEEPERLYTHGLHVLPSLSAFTGRIFQESAALKINVLIGSLALLAVYGFTRLLTKPRWAFLSTAVLSLSLPMIYFSRDMYTEPISMLYIFTLFSLLYFAKKTRNRALWGISGFMAGASLMTRIDAYLGLVGVVSYLAIFLALSAKKDKKPNIINISIFFASAFAVAIIGWLDLTKLATSYYRFHAQLIQQQLLLVGAVAIVGLITTMLFWKYGLQQKVYKKISSRTTGTIFVVLVSVLIVGLFARPLVIEGIDYYEVQEIGGTQSIVVQEEQTPNSIGYNVGEQVILWPTWYLGMLFSIFGVLGLLLIIKRSAEDKNLYLLPFLLTFISISSLYLFKPSITPDHIWASRRLLPVILPGVAVLAAYLLSSIKIKKLYSIILYIALSAIFITSTLNVSGFLLTEKVRSPLLTQVNDFCAVLPEDSAVLLVGIMGLVSVQTINSYCGVPTVRYVGSPTQEEYQEFYIKAEENKKIPVVAAFVNDKGLLVEGSLIKNLDVTEYKIVEKVFETYPKKTVKTSKEIIYGIIQEDGVVSQIIPASINIIKQ